MRENRWPPAEDHAADDPDTKNGHLAGLPEEPWFYGSLWRYGLALRFFADGGAFLFFLWSFVVFMGIGGRVTSEAYTGLAMAGFVSALFVVGLVWFILRLTSAAVLLMVDSARNIRTSSFAIKVRISSEKENMPSKCRRQDLNLHYHVANQPLNLACLPIPPLRRVSTQIAVNP